MATVVHAHHSILHMQSTVGTFFARMGSTKENTPRGIHGLDCHLQCGELTPMGRYGAVHTYVYCPYTVTLGRIAAVRFQFICGSNSVVDGE